MKIHHPLNFILLLLTLTIAAQTGTPKLINYQAVIRGAAGNPLPNKTIKIVFDLHEAGASGPIIFNEVQTVTTNSLGLVSTQIGKVNNLSVVSWTNGPYFLDLLVDTTGGSNFTTVGSQQLVSVPFALYAGNATTYSPSANISITSPGNVIDLTPTLPSSVTVGDCTGLSTIPQLTIDANGRTIGATQDTANVSGDITGPLSNQSVIGIQGVPVVAATPQLGQVLGYTTNGWAPVSPTTAAGPWSYAAGSVFPTNNPLTDKVMIGQSSGSSLLNVVNNAGSGVTNAPVVTISNSNSAYSSSAVLSVTNFSGTGAAAVYVQNAQPGNSSQGIVVNMTNTTSTSAGITSSHAGQGTAGAFVNTNASNFSSVLFAQTNASGGYAIDAKNIGGGSAFTASNNATAPTAQLTNSGNGNVIYASSTASTAGIISYNAGGGAAIHGANTSTVSNGGAHGVVGQTDNPSTNANGVLGVNTNAGPAIYALNTYTANASSFAHGLRGETNNPAAQATGVLGQNNSVGAGVTGINTTTTSSGNAFGVYGQVSNSAVNSSGVFGKNLGAGNGVTGTSSSFASNAAGIYGDNTGNGYAVYGVKQGASTGSVARFDNLNSSNSADGLFSLTQGSGAAVHAASGTGTASALALLVEQGHIKAIGNPISIMSTSVSNGWAGISSPTCTNCNDIRGTVSFVTSATGFVTPNFADVTVGFSKNYSTVPVVNITPLTDMQNISYMISNTTTSSFTIRIYRSGNTAGGSLSTTVPSATFKFNYFVIE